MSDIPLENVAIYGFFVVNGMLTAIVMFFLLRVLKRGDRFTDMNTALQLVQQDVIRISLENKGLNEIHQYFGVLKNNQEAVFKRIDELRGDFKDMRAAVEHEVKGLREETYVLKGKIDNAQI